MITGLCRVCGAPLPAQKPGQRRLYCSPSCRRKVEIAHRRLRNLSAELEDLLESARFAEAAYERARRGHRYRLFKPRDISRYRLRAAAVETELGEVAASVGLERQPNSVPIAKGGRAAPSNPMISDAKEARELAS